MSCTNYIAWRRTSIRKSKEKESEEANIEKFQLMPDEEQALEKAIEKESEEANIEKFHLYVICAWHLLLLQSKCHAWIGQPDKA